ncbi:hypothetical protein NDU88_006307 [Pleurodeles waltl]|uniref:Uncharacterized protein n=1 Tax=Pleurodeles waltl TaxID=8319 RepID=A0AAV7MBU8_PLEWA|nr:hypothetical protein NDU88_006307 [Pleurodeles waltl]
MSGGGARHRKKAEREDATQRCSRRLLGGLVVSGRKRIKNGLNIMQLPRILHSCHYKWRRGSQLLTWPTSEALHA